jgi:hypothetical protein
MSLKIAAQHLASKGRGPDTELIHMTKGEIAGLQSLAKAHGGSLTVNPETGLVEAGFLKAILPMALGAGLAAVTGGTSLALTPGMIGMGLGGLETLRTGNLMKGLTMGMGAYGGAGLASGLAGLGTSEAGANVSAAAEQAGNEAATAELAKQQALQASATQGAAVGAPGTFTTGGISPEAFAQSARDAAADAYMPTAAQQAALNSPISTGFSAAVSDPSKLATQMGGYGALGKAGLAAAAPVVADAMTPKFNGMPVAEGDSDMGPRYRFEPGVANPFPQANAAGSEQNYYPNQKYTRLSDADAKALYGYAEGGDVQFPYGESVMRMAQGGISSLGGYSDGGRMLKGPGDGMSDSIPAQIGNKQPARLADGEFVVPADVVSHLGNGSTDAGAKQLYKMMDRIRHQRTGKKRQAPEVNPGKAMPA